VEQVSSEILAAKGCPSNDRCPTAIALTFNVAEPKNETSKLVRTTHSLIPR